ncbi:4Fe-4S binding protein [uncultured Desulfovibrio sp.]|uniref:4Fe-4S binding protein n=1 Tax=uncultured Desulfovibrio sp. TaxID=167968 RepID=UPI00262831E5|nr:4Fe-4S binding protein [uncultured Desulfovibrio sp.]
MRIRLSFLRGLSRLGTAVAFCVLPWLNAAGMHGVSGSLFSLDVFGWPFGDPAALVQTLAGGGRPGAHFLLGVGSSLALAFLLGRVFCGWLCPYGLLSEAAATLGGRLRARPRAWKVPARWELACRAVVLAAGTGLAACGIPALTRLSFPGSLSLAPQIACYNGFDGVFFGLLAAPVTALLLEFLTGERLWCRFVCPQGLLLGCAARLRSWCGRWSRLPLPTVRWEASCCSCKGETPCAAACTLGVQPRRKDGPDALRCSICGECVSVCARKGRALRWKV